ncbi:fungal-specific transcription factor domain-containing protein [Aspergillus pseudodeflectus]|uniref:Fungal-specific transcription factor domain-containing protein n=1 Tax=Aspergillus pseudodeflectus TaxID=176178 RepID=A0ABR4JVY4_9EURO
MGFPFIIWDLLPLISTSPVLHQAVMAVGALHANRNNVERASIKEKVAAMRSYHMSMVALQECLGDKNVVQRDDVLWATFFLGLFELLSDHSGEGWAKHMLYGTSKMLQLVGPSGCKSSLRRAFYDLFRVLEASRSLLYNEETILSQQCWLQLHVCSDSDITTRWEPMEEITILMIQTSAFSLRARSLVESVPELDRYTDASITILATEGLEIQATIYNWHTEALLHLSQGCFDGYIDLSLLYYHALLIFLSGNFDYFPYWNNIPAPVLCPMDVSDHLSAILELAEQILSQYKIPGVMLFFPLTVAGSRARDPAQRSQIVSLLDRVFRTGFVVANRVKIGIQDRWVKRDEVLLPDPLVDSIEA